MPENLHFEIVASRIFSCEKRIFVSPENRLMKNKTFTLTLENKEQIAKEFIEFVGTNRKIAFNGSMGAGKTTFITALCEELKAGNVVSSPTFSIVNEYETESDELIYHFDFYRIKEPTELFDIGFEEYCAREHWCFIEWPERALELIPDDFLFVSIQVKEGGERIIQFMFSE